VGALTLLAALAAGVDGLRAEEPLMYVFDGDAIVFTNTPLPEARPVPGLEATDGGLPAEERELPATRYDPYIERVARENDLSPTLIKAVALVESGFDARAVSKAGAQGLMQLMPATASEYGVADAFNPLENLRAGARHLRRLLDRYEGDLTLALAAYNAGEGAVARHRGVPNYAETVDYVRRIHEKMGRRPGKLPSTGPPTRPARLTVLSDGSVLLSN
jgi:soluble lytic murein transglycosylase-like protein